VSKKDLEYLGNLKRPNGSPLLKQATLDFLKDFTLPDYNVSIDENNNYELAFI